MGLEFSESELKILEGVRDYIAEHTTPELIEESMKGEYIYGGPESRKFFKEFAANGWLVPAWPEAYGGLGTSEILTYYIKHEFSLAAIPHSFAAAHMAGPMILRYGSQVLKDKYLLRIARGEIEFNVAYSEPGAGSDLLSLKTSARDMGDYYLVNGQKVFSTFAHVADYCWLAVRTDPDAPNHQGISLMLVQMDAPGITVRPMWTMGGSRTNEVFLDDVIIPKTGRIGEENQGVKYIMGQLEFERMFPYGHHQRFFYTLVDTVKNDDRIVCDASTRRELAQRRVELEVCKKLYFRLPEMLNKQQMPKYESAMSKLYVTEYGQQLAKTAMTLFGQYAQLTGESPLAPAEGEAELAYRASLAETIYGGTSEIMRTLIAQRGLGLPRGKISE